MFKEMAANLITAQGEMFNMNEYPYDVSDHLVYFDFDGELDDLELSIIEESFNGQTTGPIKLQVAIKPSKNRYHIITNIRNGARDNKSILAYLKPQLKEALGREDFDKIFDENACGLNSIYSYKHKDGQLLPEFYVPNGQQMVRPAPKQMVEDLWRYSIYNISGAISFTRDTLEAIDKQYLETQMTRLDSKAKEDECEEGEINEFWDKQEDWYKDGNLNVNGTLYPVNGAFITTLVNSLDQGHRCDTGKKWKWIAKVVKFSIRGTDYNYKHFLHEWCSAGKGYDEAGNNMFWHNRDIPKATQGQYITMLYKMAAVDNWEKLIAELGGTDYDNLINREDEGIANIFERIHKATLRMIDTKGSTYGWDETHRLWMKLTPDQVRRMIATTISGVCAAQMARLNTAAGKDEAKRKAIENQVKLLARVNRRILGAKGQQAAWTVIKCRFYDSEFFKLLDKNVDYLPILKGQVVDLRTGLTRPRTCEDMFTFECPVTLTTDNADVAEQFMLSIMNDNEAMRSFFQKVLGYCITGHTTERKMFLWWGQGSNGKSTVQNLLRKILTNTFYITAAKEIWVQGGRASSGGATPHLIPLVHARVACSSETNEDEKLNGALIKELTGSDNITARPMYGEQFEFTPICKQILATNHKPDFNVGDKAMVDRLCYIPFLARFVEKPGPGEKLIDKKLGAKLEGEYLNAIFTWIVKGAMQWYADGHLEPPAEIKAAVTEYVEELDIMGQFVRDRCIADDGTKTSAMILMERFKGYCNLNGLDHNVGQRQFGQKMKQYFRQSRTNKGNVYHVRFIEDDVVMNLDI